MRTSLLKRALCVQRFFCTNRLSSKAQWPSNTTNLFYFPHRLFNSRCFSSFSDKDREADKLGGLENILDQELDGPEDEETKSYFLLRNNYMNVLNAVPQVLVIQPFVRTNHHDVTQGSTNPQLMLQESLALVRTLNWKIVDSLLVGLRSTQSRTLFGSGKTEEILEKINKDQKITSIFISIYKLSPVQRIALETAFNLPIIDRYSLVLQIFDQHARTQEAKLQVALAEIPYLKHRLDIEYFVEQNSKHSKGNLGEQAFQTKKFALKKMKQKIVKKIDKIREQRQKLRESKSRTKFATVAIVGYTNCGKTTLIRSLTGDESLEPENKLFATLDVTTHLGHLPETNLPCLFIDTVGFISDIPTALIASFSATLEDALLADLVVHVRDLSHPDTEHQNKQVLSTFRKLGLETTQSNMITVANKIDKIGDVGRIRQANSEGAVPVSALLDIGLDHLQRQIEHKLIINRELHRSTVKVKTGSDMMDWLMANVTVTDIQTDSENNNFSLLKILWNDELKGKFERNFIKGR